MPHVLQDQVDRARAELSVLGPQLAHTTAELYTTEVGAGCCASRPAWQQLAA